MPMVAMKQGLAEAGPDTEQAGIGLNVKNYRRPLADHAAWRAPRRAIRPTASFKGTTGAPEAFAAIRKLLLCVPYCFRHEVMGIITKLSALCPSVVPFFSACPPNHLIGPVVDPNFLAPERIDTRHQVSPRCRFPITTTGERLFTSESFSILPGAQTRCQRIVAIPGSDATNQRIADGLFGVLHVPAFVARRSSHYTLQWRQPSTTA